MANATKKSKQSRSRREAEPNPSMVFQPRPTITYGTRNKPLLLQGTQFMRRDLIDSPSDIRHHETHVSPRHRQGVRLPDPDDSPLSEEELEAVCGNSTDPSGVNASPAQSSPSRSTGLERTSGIRRPKACLPYRKEGIGFPSKRPVDKSTDLAVLQVNPNKDLVRKAAKETVSVRPQAAEVAFDITEPQVAKEATARPVDARARREIVQLDSVNPKDARRKIATPIRRLPVNELLMVQSPPEQSNYSCDPDSDLAGIQMQHPIADSSSPMQKVVGPGLVGKTLGKVTSLTSIRKRLKTPKPIHKSVIIPGKIRTKQKPKLLKIDRDLGDGFDASEIKARPHQAKKQRRNDTSILRGLGALQLQCGPLPEVKFEANLQKTKAEPSAEGTFQDNNSDAAPITTLQSDLREDKNDRRVTFSDSFFDESTRAQLSSVSAPKRVFEISSDESEQEDEDEEEEDEGYEEYDDGAERTEMSYDKREHNNRSDDEHRTSQLEVSTDRGVTPTSFQRVRLLSDTVTEDSAAPACMKVEATKKAGVTLDFRSPTTPSFARRKLRKRRLMEVNEMIIDDPFAEDPSTILPKTDTWVRDCTSEDQRGVENRLADPSRRPRSILRPGKPVQHGRSGTRPEDTLANTRRNSTIAVESAYFHDRSVVSRGERAASEEQPLRIQSERVDIDHPEQDNAYDTVTRRRETAVIIEGDNDSYFGMASNQLHHSQPKFSPQRHRMSARPDLAASHFFAQRRRDSDIHVAESSRPVPETSPPRKADYMTELGRSLKFIRGDGETTWTSSQSLPTAKSSKSLKSLTRSVSREYGTMSQARKRRPTLPFHSPVKALN